MRRLNFLETVGVVALAVPSITGISLAVLLATGTIRVYRETAADRQRQAQEQSS